MVLLDKIWDDVLAGTHPDRGLGKLRKLSTNALLVKDAEGESSGGKYQRSLSSSVVSPTTPLSACKAEDVWQSLLQPGSNLATKNIGTNFFKPMPSSPTVYDWLYSSETKSTHR